MAKESLAAKAGALKEAPQAPALPDIFSSPPEEVKAREWAPYVSFAHPNKKDEWAKIVGKYPQAQDGQMFFIGDGQLLHMTTLKAGLIHCKQYWAKSDANGKMLSTSEKELPDPFKEYIEAVLLVYLEDRIVPCNCQMRTTKCSAGKILADALKAASNPTEGDPAWANMSPAHKETLICNQPYQRFYGLITLAPPRTGKESGKLYSTTLCTIQPTAMSEWRMQDAFFKSEDAQKRLEEAGKFYKKRIDSMKALLGK